jgi:hypothetical protein
MPSGASGTACRSGNGLGRVPHPSKEISYLVVHGKASFACTHPVFSMGMNTILYIKTQRLGRADFGRAAEKKKLSHLLTNPRIGAIVK